MAALNMGGMDLRYTRTNSVEALKWSIAHGFENFTLAVRMTSDQKLVCVDRWHRETYHMMNIPIPDEEKEYQPQLYDLKNQLHTYERLEGRQTAKLREEGNSTRLQTYVHTFAQNYELNLGEDMAAGLNLLYSKAAECSPAAVKGE
jgi:glycerophosphoryl diester phosphodiesterase